MLYLISIKNIYPIFKDDLTFTYHPSQYGGFQFPKVFYQEPKVKNAKNKKNFDNLNPITPSYYGKHSKMIFIPKIPRQYLGNGEIGDFLYENEASKRPRTIPRVIKRNLFNGKINPIKDYYIEVVTNPESRNFFTSIPSPWEYPKDVFPARACRAHIDE